jgi:hypothetical protein
MMPFPSRADAKHEKQPTGVMKRQFLGHAARARSETRAGLRSNGGAVDNPPWVQMPSGFGSPNSKFNIQNHKQIRNSNNSNSKRLGTCPAGCSERVLVPNNHIFVLSFLVPPLLPARRHGCGERREKSWTEKCGHAIRQPRIGSACALTPHSMRCRKLITRWFVRPRSDCQADLCASQVSRSESSPTGDSPIASPFV